MPVGGSLKEWLYDCNSCYTLL